LLLSPRKINPDTAEPIGAPNVKMNSKADSRKTREWPTITDIRVAIKPSQGPRIIPEIGLMMKIHPNQMPEEKPGVTIESRAMERTANTVIREILRASNLLPFTTKHEHILS
jgi:hypothetical protein